jgi:hypothetical protein
MQSQPSHRIIAPLFIALVLLVSACGQAATSSKPLASPAVSSPSGVPLPPQLIGDWVLSPYEVNSILVSTGNGTCPLPLAAATCTVHLALGPTTYYWSSNLDLREGGGNAIVNGSEIDFWEAGICGIPLPAGLGRYIWSLTGGWLRFTALNQDPCPRLAFLDGQTFNRVRS